MSDEDDRFDAFLKQAAQSYNAPPETPRDAMWARIEAERHARRARPAALRDRGRIWWMMGIGIAAALLLGLGIGRYWGAHAPGERSSTVATTDGSRAPAVAQPEAGVSTPPGSHGDTVGHGAAPARATMPSTLARSAPRDGEPYVATPGARKGDATNRAYEVATIEHLGRAEALLTAFRAESRSGEVDRQVTAWAGDLLSTTRLLLDSPAAKDPRLAKLLGDLEFVLAQITQLQGQKGARPDELELIDQAVRQHEMLMRLRATIPAGTIPAGS
jgi:hypothetical protein